MEWRTDVARTETLMLQLSREPRLGNPEPTQNLLRPVVLKRVLSIAWPFMTFNFHVENIVVAKD
jgi:hypothetical protein